MKAAQALKYFKDFVRTSGKSIEHLSVDDSIQLMTGFYKKIRVDDCKLEEDGDMLLFEWGVYDWGRGSFFTYTITRQFIFPETFGDAEESWLEDVFWQLSLSYAFNPTDELKSVKRGHKWCESPNNITDFLEFITTCEATQILKGYPVETIELTFERQ